ncbi:MAG: PfkB family carbohydrate kinase [Devosia sp.]
MSGVVLCVGALSLDTIFRLDALPRGPGKFLPEDALQVAQGMATAQAATIVALGGRARLWASAADDPTGDRLLEELAAAGIDLAVRRVAGARSGFSSILMDGSGERIIVPFYDAALRSPPETPPPMDDVAVVSVDVRWPDAALAAFVAGHDRMLPCLVDLEVGPRDTLLKLFHNATHAIASEGGAQILTGEPTGLDALKIMAREHPGFVAVTLGENGAFFADRKTGVLRHVAPFPVTAVDTLAAGDVFHGAFALRLAEGADEADAMRFAAAAAALKCTRFGGRLGAPARADVEAMLA